MRAWMMQLHRHMVHWSAKSARALYMEMDMVPYGAVAPDGGARTQRGGRYVILKCEINKISAIPF